jgi:hypothetical protein
MSLRPDRSSGRSALRLAATSALLAALIPAGAGAGGRERAIEQIPELMGRILDSQEQIRERESEMAPIVQRYNESLVASKQRIEAAATEDDAAEALVDYVEAYSARLEAQETGLRSIESAVVRMRADSRELAEAAAQARGDRERPEERRAYYVEQFQGVAAATGALAERLGRSDEAATAGAVLHASWASHGALDLPFPQMGPESAARFARKVDGLYARFQARSNQLAAEQRSVRRLLDLLIERQLAQRLDSLFAGGEAVGLAALFDGAGRSHDWQDLGSVVARTLGLPSGGLRPTSYDTASLDRLDFFADGGHRNP